MQAAEVIPLIRGATSRLDKLDRSQLLAVYEQYRTASNEWLRRQILENHRVDILAHTVLGYDVQPFHLKMMIWQILHPQSLILSFRGGGKSTTCTVTKAIYYFCKNRDYRLVLGSESKGNSAGFLREIKGHFENNDRLIEVFGPFYDPHIVGKWDTQEIDVVGKKHFGKESSIFCTGIDASVTSKHFHGGLFDDLCVEENSRTPAMREKVRTWYYKTWTPLILPPNNSIEHCGELHGLGTRQHPEDHYGHLERNEMKGQVLEISALDDNENSPWPEMYPPEFFKEQRRKMGVILFNAQYQQNVEAMRGKIFSYDQCQQLPDEEWPSLDRLLIYMGVDLAVGDKDRDAMFALSVIGIKGSVKKDDFLVYLLDYFLDHLRASLQEDKVIEFYDKWKPLRTGIETNQYQDVLRQRLKKSRPSMVVKKIHTVKDKTFRGQQRAPLFEGLRVFFRDGGRHARPIDHLVRFPEDKFTKDYFDSLDFALEASVGKKRKKKRPEFGVL